MIYIIKALIIELNLLHLSCDNDAQLPKRRRRECEEHCVRTAKECIMCMSVQATGNQLTEVTKVYTQSFTPFSVKLHPLLALHSALVAWTWHYFS